MRIRDHLNIDRLWSRAPVVGVLRFEGVIMSRPRRGGVSLASHAAAIERAFRVSNLVAVAVVVNSPGGSAVQSALLFRRIRELAEERHVPVIAFAEDVAASGGYWLALAGDEIFSEETSILGSIGVISASFGFAQLIERLGVERRLYTAGERKSLLDPFLPQSPSDVERLTVLQKDIHRAFKEHVQRHAAGQDKIRPFAAERRRWPFWRRLPFSAGEPAAAIADLADWIEARLLWASFGL